MDELVSVIIPVYNVEKFLPDCVLSVMNQTYKNMEIILVDDGSTDGCSRLCDEFALTDERIIVIHKQNGGQGSARNRALDCCKGKYVAFLDSDDYWEVDYVECLLRVIKENDSEIAVCNYQHVSEKNEKIGGPTTKINIKNYSNIEAMKVMLYWKEFGVAPWAKLYLTSLWKDIRFAEDRIYEDLATTYKVFWEARKITFINEVKMSYRIRANSDIHQKFNTRKIRILDSADEILEFCKTKCLPCVRAAESRQVASASFIYFRIPQEELKENASTVHRCQDIIKRYRWKVMTDRESRRKTRIGALLSYFGFTFERWIFSRVVL